MRQGRTIMPQASLRKNIKDLSPTPGNAHIGLWLDRMLLRQLEEGDRLREGEIHPHTDLINQATKIPEPEDYRSFFDHWNAALKDIDGIQMRTATVRGRMVVGLGAEGVLETSIMLHH